ncbi:MAG: MBL fold metallo-hydrolase [Azovibrio sp.]|uniref:MBL fold metallo-hydrolase n=1 Tax=Azovibrio sp. TaxID=1872673 RepID=UPI003C713DF4
MKASQCFFQDGEHKWVAIVRDPDRPDALIDTNEYLVACNGSGLLLDPGGAEIFPAVFSALSSGFDPASLVGLFASHQDPDIISSLALWLEFNPRLPCYVSWLWASFIPHFGGSAESFVAIPDEGMEINLNGLPLQAVPAHYLHASGNFHLYDARAKVLFSGDVGAALLPSRTEGLFVENFDAHIRHAEAFHRRWMGSNEAKRAWCERVSRLKIDMLCPQHGAIYQNQDVERFINWFDGLRVGVAVG